MKTQVEEDVFTIGRVTIYSASRTVEVEGRRVYLKPREFALLAFLASHVGQTFTREELLLQVWEYDYVATTRTVDVHVRQLRKKIEPKPDEPTYVQTIWGVGYRLNPDVK
ncbi:MAG: winged helix-turn-helix domain-containing protein [Bacteroidota bacterium]